MSDERRRYNARQRQLANTSNPTSDTTATRGNELPPLATRYAIVAPDWDEEAIEEARQQAALLLDMNANDQTALLMLEKARLAEIALSADEDTDTDTGAVSTSSSSSASSTTSTSATPRQHAHAKPFDPARLFARLAKYYRFSDSDMRQMPFKRLLMYAREMDIMLEEENAAYDKARRDGSRGSGGTSRAMVDGKAVDAAYAESQLSGYVVKPQEYSGPTVPLVE